MWEVPTPTPLNVLSAQRSYGKSWENLVWHLRGSGWSVVEDNLDGCGFCRGPFFGFSGLPFGGLVASFLNGASILAPCETILAPRARPREPFQNPRTALEDHGSGRIDTRWSETGFKSILE